MARKLRVQYPGAVDHVMNRGDRREAIFEDDKDRERRGEDLRREFKRVERGWCLGGEEFRQELLEQVDTRPGPSHFGEVVQEAEAAQAEQVVIAGLKRMGWREADLRARREGEPRKVDLAWELRSQTTMPLAWIAERLKMGTRGHLAWLLRQRGKSRPAAPANQRLLRI